VDRSPEVAQLFQIRGVPTLIVFKKGKVRWRQSGVFPANDLERVLRENMDE
jgi:thioredoxin 1